MVQTKAPSVGDADALADLLTANREWSKAVKYDEPDLFPSTATSQSPSIFWVGCSDSRVVPELATGMKPGQLFMHRNVGNLVQLGDLNCMSALEYSVGALGVQHVVVCGHYGCGACKAALTMASSGSSAVNAWINNIRMVRDKNSRELAKLQGDKRWNRMCELNLAQQVFNVCTSPAVQQAWAAGKPLQVHGFMYDVADGQLTRVLKPITALEGKEVGEVGKLPSATAGDANGDLMKALIMQLQGFYAFETAS